MDLKVKGRYMRSELLSTVLCLLVFAGCAWAQQPSSCASLLNFKLPKVEITKAAPISAGSTESIPWSQSRSAPLPAYCRVEGVINRRIGVDGEEFGITFALAMPDKWNSRPHQWSRLAEPFRIAAAHSVPIHSTRITRAREIRRMRTTSNAVDFQD